MGIIGILAKKQHGKNTTGDILIDLYEFDEMSFAAPLKEAASVLFGLSDEQLYGDQKEVVDSYWRKSPREILQYVGTQLFRDNMEPLIPGIGQDFWVRVLKKHYIDRMKKNPNEHIVVTDVRFQNEVDAIHDLGGTVIKIVRPGMENGDEHASETSIDQITNFDILMMNDGTIDDLREKIEDLFSAI